MKSLKCIIILSLIFLISCKNNKAGNTDEIVDVKDSVFDMKSTIKKSLKTDVLLSIKTPKNCNEISFEVFFERFGKDSLFQKQRVKYPLKESYIESLDPTIIKTDTIYNISEYKYIDFIKDKDGMKREYEKYSIEIEKIDNENIYYKNLGYDNGIHIIFKFKLIAGCWFLVEILDEST